MVQVSIARALTWLAEREPDHPAVRDDVEQLTRADLDSRSNSLARAYARLGVGHDDLVTVTLPNGVEFVVACVAIWKLGATPQPLSHRLPLEERRAIVELAGSILVVGAEPDEFPGVATVPINFRSGERNGMLPDAAATSWKAPTSSGSTGLPKIVVAAAGATIDPESRVAAFIPKDAVQLVAGPLYHSAPFTYAMRGLMTGHSLVVLPRFDAELVLRAIDDHGVTWMMLVPTMMKRILDLPAATRKAASLASLESIVHLGASIDPDVKLAWIEWIGPDRVNEVYVGTESAGLTMITGAEWLEHPGSVGRAIGGSTMRVVGEDGLELPRGELGRIQMTRSGGPTYRYRGQSGSPKNGNKPDDWDTLGDMGYQDDEGYLWIVDRADDLIISGSVNVYPIEIERVLEHHPDVRSAVAFGLPDADLGARIHAIVDVAGSGIDADELLAWVGLRLDPEKLPRSIEVVHEPVRDDAGKVRRGMLARERIASADALLD